MFSTSIKLITATALVLTSCARHYRAEGVVLKVDASRRTLTISHRAIPGYMEGMAMPFQVADVKDLHGLTPGSRVRFTLHVKRSGSYISAVRKQKIALDDVVLPRAATPVAIGEAVKDFVLVDQAGETVKLSSFRGGVVAIDFIYTRCPLPDVCPRLSANFALLQRRFGGRITLLSVTIDPQFDTSAVLAEYARRWQAGPGWHFLTGTSAQVRVVAEQFGLIYWPEDGLMTHSSATALVGPSGTLLASIEGSAYTSRQLTDLVSAALQ